MISFDEITYKIMPTGNDKIIAIQFRRTFDYPKISGALIAPRSIKGICEICKLFKQ